MLCAGMYAGLCECMFLFVLLDLYGAWLLAADIIKCVNAHAAGRSTVVFINDLFL